MENAACGGRTVFVFALKITFMHSAYQLNTSKIQNQIKTKKRKENDLTKGRVN